MPSWREKTKTQVWCTVLPASLPELHALGEHLPPDLDVHFIFDPRKHWVLTLKELRYNMWVLEKKMFLDIC